jgi:hypothetical protein
MRNHYARDCEKFFKDDQKKKTINRRNFRRSDSNRLKKIIKHMFFTITLYLNIEQKTIRIMINYNATFNFIF